MANSGLVDAADGRGSMCDDGINGGAGYRRGTSGHVNNRRGGIGNTGKLETDTSGLASNKEDVTGLGKGRLVSCCEKGGRRAPQLWRNTFKSVYCEGLFLKAERYLAQT